MTAYEALKLRKKSKYIIFRLNDKKTEIIPEKESLSTDYDEFLKDLPETECRWAVYDLEFQNDEGGLRKKIIFLQWYVGSSTKRNSSLAQKFVPMGAHMKCTYFIFYFPLSLSLLMSFCLSPFSLQTLR